MSTIYKSLIIVCLILQWTMTSAASPIHFATEATYPPFEQINSQGTITGFDIEIAQAICEQLQRPCQFSNQPWSSLLPGLKMGKFDALIASINITTKRSQQVAFTQPYYYATASLVAPIDTDITLSEEQLHHKTIGVQVSTAMHEYLKAYYAKQVRIKSYASIADAFLDLAAGRLDAVFADTATANYWLSQHHQAYKTIGSPIHDDQFFGQGIAIAVAQDNQILLQQINEALRIVMQSEHYQNLLRNYFNTNTTSK